jgi:hypothetical protein
MATTNFIDKKTVIEATWLNGVDAHVYGTVTPQYFAGDGSTTIFTLNAARNNPSVYISGVWQNKNTFTVVGLVLTFSEAPPYGTTIEVVS